MTVQCVVVGALWGELGVVGMEFLLGYVVVAGVFLLLLVIRSRGRKGVDYLFVCGEYVG